MNGISLNPANIAGCKEKYAFNLLSAGFGIDNNVGDFNLSGGLVVAVGSGKTNNMFSYHNNSRISMLAPYVDIVGPGLMASWTRIQPLPLLHTSRG